MKRYIIYLLFLIAFCNCEDDDMVKKETGMRNDFQEQTTAGIYQGGTAMARYEAEQHQLAYTDDLKSWHIQTDDRTFLLSCRLNDKAETDKIVTVSVKAKGIQGLEDFERRGYVLKMENHRCWVWMPETNTGIILQFNNQ